MPFRLSFLSALTATVLLLAAPAWCTTELSPDSSIPGFDPTLFMNSWQNAAPVVTHGTLTEYPILTKVAGDPLKATVKGQVLSRVNRLSRAELAAGARTAETTLKGEQEVFYVLEGVGAFTARGTAHPVRAGHFILAPAGLTFTIAAGKDAPLVMYLMNEPVPADFTPEKDLVITDENEAVRREGNPTAHWWHNPRGGIGKGLASVLGVSMITFDPMAVGQPHSHPKDWEEVWLCVEGDLTAMLGTHLYPHEPGTAYRIPPTGLTPHSDINVSDKPAKCLIFLGGPTSQADNQLEYAPLDPAKDPDIDLFIGDWRKSIPYNVYGALTERAILTPGDPAAPRRTGAVLTGATLVARTTLEPLSHTTPSTLDGVQEIYAVTEGIGSITCPGLTAALMPGAFVFIPAGIEFTMENTGDEPLVMYLVREPVPAGFKPRRNILLRKIAPNLAERWDSDGMLVFEKKDGLATLDRVTLQYFLPGMVNQPISRAATEEEVRLTLDGSNLALIGKQVRFVPAGAAYKVPPTSRTPRADLNVSDKPVIILGIVAGE